jgi:hypothetical protein
MTKTLEAIRQLLTRDGYEIIVDAEKVPPGGLFARRGTSSVVVYGVDEKPIADSGPTMHVRLAPDNERPTTTEISARAEVPGLRRSLIIEE